MTKDQFLAWCKQFPQSLPSYHKPLIMGVLNVTPDSFSDGGTFFSVEKACIRALEMVDEGADLIDIGGESSRPGAEKVSLEEELNRVIPAIEAIVQRTDICISIDSYKPAVMKAAIAAGAGMINDIYALKQPDALAAVAQMTVPICLMHMLGTPNTMQKSPFYLKGLVDEVDRFFEERLQSCLNAGIERCRLILDPGFGFGKTVNGNLQLLANLDHWNIFKLPLLLGVSRKSTIGALLNKPVNERLIGSIALAVHAAYQGVSIIRCHDIEETHQALLMIERIKRIG